MDGRRLRSLRTEELTSSEISAIRDLLWAAFADDDGFEEDDWAHALGGLHFIAEREGAIVAHAAVVERVLHVNGSPLRTGYVEAVATSPALPGEGIGSQLMSAVGAHLLDGFELGALGATRIAFYERLGWRVWRGPSAVRTDAGPVPTPDDDGAIMVLPTRASPNLDLTVPISCDWRPGDVW